MGIFDSVLAEKGSELNAAAIGATLGLPADKVERAIAVRAVTHSQPGETIGAAAASSGMPPAESNRVLNLFTGESGPSGLSAILERGDRGSSMAERWDDCFGT